MVCSEQYLMCSMSLQVHMQVPLQVQCVVYNVQHVECRVLPAKNEYLAVETG